jgi:hypothetical protein
MIALASILKLKFKARGESTGLGNESQKKLWSSVSEDGKVLTYELNIVAVTVACATSQ